MRVILILLAIIASLSITAQDETGAFTSYTTRDGLSSNLATCLLQDSRNFIWLGTREGLNRFDGHRFKKFFSSQNNFNSLSHNYIFHLLEYKYGQLLIATNSGLSVLNTLTGQFENDKITNGLLRAGSGTTILAIFKVAGQIWINQSGELDVLDSNLHYLYRFTDLPWAKTLKGSLIVKDGQVDSCGRLWLSTDTSGMHIVDFAAKQVWNYKNNPAQLGFLNSARYIRSFFLDEPNNILWYAPWGSGQIKYNLATNKEQAVFFGQNPSSESSSVNAIIQKDKDHLFCATGEKVYELDIHSLTFTEAAAKKVVFNFIRAKDGQFWAAGMQGLIGFKSTNAVKELLLKESPNPVDLDFFPTAIVTAQDDKMYCSYHNNLLFEIDKNRSTVNTYSIPWSRKIEIMPVCTGRPGQLWIGTTEGLFLFNTGTKQFSQPAWLPAILRKNVINLVFFDKNGTGWIGTRRPFALYTWDTTHNVIQQVTNDVIARFGSSPDNGRISHILEDDNNNLWMYSSHGGGIARFNKSSGQWTGFPTSNRYKSLLMDKGISSLYAGEKDKLWFGDQFGSGLICYDYVHDSVTRVTRSDGLPSDYIQRMVTDSANALWLTTEYAVTKFDLQQGTATSLRNTSPVSENDIMFFDHVSHCVVHTRNGRLVFITPGLLQKDTSHTEPFIDKITINNREFVYDINARTTTLNAEEKNIAIDFSGINFSPVHNTRFTYQLAGLDTSWQVADESWSAQYANLAPGNYTFSIKTSSENAEWSRVFSLFAFTIKPIFWQTTWFRLVVTGGIALLIFLIVRRRVRIIRKEAGLKHKLAETEMMALRSQMNPHFIFNSLNAIDSLIQTNQPDKATTYLARFARLIRTVLESTKNSMVPFYKDFETLELFLQLEQFRSNNKFSYELQADKELSEGDYKVPPLIIQPFVENAIHHGLLNKQAGERNLVVKVSLQGNFIKYTIRDNGVGRTTANQIKVLNKPEHQSYGIQITTDRIHLHNGAQQTNNDVVITDIMENGQPGGTEVNVTLKV